MKCVNSVRTNKLVDFEVFSVFYTYGVGVCGTVPTATEHKGLMMNDWFFTWTLFPNAYLCIDSIYTIKCTFAFLEIIW